MFKILSGGLIYILGVYFFFNVSGFIESFFSLILSIYGLQRIGEGLEEKRTGKIYSFLKTKDSKIEKDKISDSARNNYFYILKLKELFDGRSGITILASVMASISIHIAKSDGQISDKEIESIRFSINRIFGGKVEHNFISEVVRITKEHLNAVGLGNILSSILEVFRIYMDLIAYLPPEERHDFTINLFTMLYEVALADEGKLNAQEERIFHALYGHFGIPLEYQDIIRRTAYYNYTARNSRKKSQVSVPSINLKDSLELFGLKENYTKEELEKAWKKLALMYHPDKYHNSDPELYKVMNDKFVQAKEVYEFLLNNIK